MHLRSSQYRLFTFLMIVITGLYLNACSHATDGQQENSTEQPLTVSQQKSQQQAFFDQLRNYCGARFIGKSSFPVDPDDSFYDKTLIATFLNCDDKEIRIPFSVGDDHSRTWIFTMTDSGLQLKHQHLHKDGTPDDISNYGGLAKLVTLKDMSNAIGLVETTVSFPADVYTQNLIPAAATNVWNISLSKDVSNRNVSLTYYLTRHDKARFKATLKRSEIKL